MDRIVVQPGDARGGKHRDEQLHGDLFEMLHVAEAAAAGHPPTQRREQMHKKPHAG